MTLCTPDGPRKDTFLCHIASRLEDALEWCELNANMAGKQDNWHWAISIWYTDDSDALDALNYQHYTRALESCDVDGVVKTITMQKITDNKWEENDYENMSYRATSVDYTTNDKDDEEELTENDPFIDEADWEEDLENEPMIAAFDNDVLSSTLQALLLGQKAMVQQLEEIVKHLKARL